MRIAAAVVLLAGRSASVDAESFRLAPLGGASLNIYSAMTYFQYGGAVFTGGISATRNRLARIDLDGGRVTEYFEIHRFLGSLDKRILVSTIDSDHLLKVLFVDPLTMRRTPAPQWGTAIDWAVLEHRSGSFFSARLDGQGVYTTYRFEPAGRDSEWLEFPGVPVSVTPDTLHLLVQNPDDGAVVVWDIERRAISGRFRNGAGAGQIRFLSNTVLLAPPRYTGQGRWHVYDLQGAPVAEVGFNVAGADPLFLWFSDDLRRAIVCLRGRLNPEVAVADSVVFRDWLLQKGHLFAERSGVLNDSRVRVRQYPVLEAKVLGHLDEGQRVSVLDRSGRREKIGEMNDYWYRVRAEGGLTGWAYGHFIDLR